MLLSDIISELRGSVLAVENFKELEIFGVCENSREVGEGDIFVGVRGERLDGNSFIGSAIRRGCRCVVTDKEIIGNVKETVIKCKNARKTLAEISKILYGDPTGKIKLIGITGTKGKSTTAEFLYSLMKFCDIPAAKISTLGVGGISVNFESCENTTPSAPMIYRMINQAIREGKEYFIIEVSSQALSHYRVFGLTFDTVIYTGFSYDHVGPYEHKCERDYFMAKRRLFCDYSAKLAIVLDDGELSERMSYGVERIVRVGDNAYDEYRISSVYSADSGVVFTLSGVDIRLGMLGEYNAKNAALAIACISELSGVDIRRLREALLDTRIKGRFELYTLGNIGIIIDFAHNADSMRSLFLSVRKICLGRIIAVFGSVGERANSRRRENARIAEEYADFSVITADNPGNESEEDICKEIQSFFMNKRKSRIITDRKEAIKHALALAEDGDYVLLLGKGHEEYQRIGKRDVRFSERAIIESLGARRSALYEAKSIPNQKS